MGIALMAVSNVSAQATEQQQKQQKQQSQATSQEGEVKRVNGLKHEATPVATKKISLEGIQQKEAKPQETRKEEAPKQD